MTTTLNLALDQGFDRLEFEREALTLLPSAHTAAPAAAGSCDSWQAAAMNQPGSSSSMLHANPAWNGLCQQYLQGQQQQQPGQQQQHHHQPPQQQPPSLFLPGLSHGSYSAHTGLALPSRPSSRCDFSPRSGSGYSGTSSHVSYPDSSHTSSLSTQQQQQYWDRQYSGPSSAEHQQHEAQLLGLAALTPPASLHQQQQEQKTQHSSQQQQQQQRQQQLLLQLQQQQQQQLQQLLQQQQQQPPQQQHQLLQQVLLRQKQQQEQCAPGTNRTSSSPSMLSPAMDALLLSRAGASRDALLVAHEMRLLEQQQQQQQQQQQMLLARSSSAVAGLATTSGAAAAAAQQPAGERPQVSHSCVEKQRRDRINALIDELRDLVPPTPPPGSASGSGRSSFDCSSAEAQRRPKHIVLADTIALVKNLKTDNRLQLKGPRPAAPPVPPVPAAVQAVQAMEALQLLRVGSSSPKPSDSHKAGTIMHPVLPHIPMTPSKLAGVHVEKGTLPGVVYLQVKCRDRRHLLADITSALKSLPAQVLSAAVKTQDDGVAIDQFEILVDDHAVDAATIQNLVHDALYHQDYKKQRL